MGPTYERVAPFNRKAAAGLINVVNLTPKTDLKALYPFRPPKVRDLKVINMAYDDKTVTLQWTAVGDYEEQTPGSYTEAFVKIKKVPSARMV